LFAYFPKGIRTLRGHEALRKTVSDRFLAEWGARALREAR